FSGNRAGYAARGYATMIVAIAERAILLGVFVSRSVWHCVTSKRPPGRLKRCAPKPAAVAQTITRIHAIYPDALMQRALGCAASEREMTRAPYSTGYQFDVRLARRQTSQTNQTSALGSKLAAGENARDLSSIRHSRAARRASAHH